MHIVTMPHSACRRLSSYASLTVRMAPVAPTGWPSAMAPPFGLTFSGSISSSRITATACAANASFNSMRSMSLIVMPAFFRRFWTAKMGATPMISGAMPATASATHSSWGVTPSSCARALVITTNAAPASLMPEELPAVTLPPSRNADLRFSGAQLLDGAVDGLQSRSAQPVDVERGCGLRKSGLQCRQAGVEGILADLADAAEDDLVHDRRRNSGPVDGRPDRVGAQVGGRGVLECAGKLADGSANAPGDNDPPSVQRHRVILAVTSDD